MKLPLKKFIENVGVLINSFSYLGILENAVSLAIGNVWNFKLQGLVEQKIQPDTDIFTCDTIGTCLQERKDSMVYWCKKKICIQEQKLACIFTGLTTVQKDGFCVCFNLQFATYLCPYEPLHALQFYDIRLQYLITFFMFVVTVFSGD